MFATILHTMIMGVAQHTDEGHTDVDVFAVALRCSAHVRRHLGGKRRHPPPILVCFFLAFSAFDGVVLWQRMNSVDTRQQCEQHTHGTG